MRLPCLHILFHESMADTHHFEERTAEAGDFRDDQDIVVARRLEEPAQVPTKTIAAIDALLPQDKFTEQPLATKRVSR